MSATKVKLRLVKEARDASDTAYRNYLTACSQAAQKARDYMAEYVSQRQKLDAAAQAAGMGEISETTMRERRSAILKELLPMERALIAPMMAAGLGGDALLRWIETGMSSREQQHQDDLRIATERANAPKPVRPGAPAPDVTDGEKTYSAAQIAKAIGADPREFRAMLRKRGLTQSSYTKKDGRRLRDAWHKEQS